MNHLIQQQHLHISVRGTEQDGMALQKWLSGYCNDWLTPAIEQVLDKYAPADRHLRIDKLEIDIGTIPQDRLEQELAGAVVKALDTAIHEKVIAASNDMTTSKKDVRLKTNVQTHWEAFVYFLETGRLPWSYRLPAGETLEMVLQSQSPGEAAYNSLRNILTNPNTRLRLVNQFSGVFLDRLLESLSREGKKHFDQIGSQLRSAGNLTKEDVLFFEKKLRLVLFEKVASGDSFSENEIVLRWVDTISESGKVSDRMSAKQTPFEVIRRIFPLAFETKKELTTKSDLVRIESSNTILKETVETEGIYIDNAGLILVHPFLSRFFEVLGIALDDKLLQPDRALGLLHFLATGQECPPEHELMLPKILCNIPLETPVEMIVPLHEAEREEAENLLKAVIQHWGALRNSSPEALREGFLSRPGKLSRRNEQGWLLQIERNSIDILLVRLPWNISLINLPWMGEMLHVEWN